jgi:hypothetical protein
MRRAGHGERRGERRGTCRVLVRKPEGKRPLGRPRCRWDNNTKMDLKEIVSEGVDWNVLAKDRNKWWTVFNAVMNLRVPQNAGNFLSRRGTVSFSRRTLLHGASIYE